MRKLSINWFIITEQTVTQEELGPIILMVKQVNFWSMLGDEKIIQLL